MGTDITKDTTRAVQNFDALSFSSDTAHSARVEQLLQDAASAMQAPEHNTEDITEILKNVFKFAELNGYALTKTQLQEEEKLIKECIIINENELGTLDPIKASYVKTDLLELFDKLGLKEKPGEYTQISVMDDENEFLELIDHLREERVSVSEAFLKFKELSLKADSVKK